MSLAVFLPTREGSQRIPNKNTRTFSNIPGGLLELKLTQLAKLNIDEVILSTDDPKSIAIAEKFNMQARLVIDTRPKSLARSETELVDLVAYVPTLTTCEHILWTHVTSPMVITTVYEKSIIKYYEALENGYDSLMSVTEFQNFLWKKELNDIVNRIGHERWPKTQELEMLYEINNAIFITPRDIYIKNKDRVGKRPYLFEMNKLESLDVDWENDFKIAEAVYDKFKK